MQQSCGSKDELGEKGVECCSKFLRGGRIILDVSSYEGRGVVELEESVHRSAVDGGEMRLVPVSLGIDDVTDDLDLLLVESRKLFLRVHVRRKLDIFRR